MKNIRIFYLETCPYCINARKALAELIEEDPRYREIGIEWIEESREPVLADQYDYYHVPAVFIGDRKLYEASPAHGYDAIKRNMRAALDAAEG